MSLLMTKLKMLVSSGIPGNNTLIDVEEAKYILSFISENKVLRDDLDLADEIHFDELVECRANVMKTNKRIN